MEIAAECVTHEYRANSDGTANFKFRAWYPYTFGYQGVGGQLINCDRGTPDTFTCQGTMDQSPDIAPFKYLSTDVNSHFAMYGCDEMLGGTMNYQYVIIMGRQNTMGNDEVSQIKAEIAKQLPNYDLSWLQMSKTPQKNCDYQWAY